MAVGIREPLILKSGMVLSPDPLSFNVPREAGARGVIITDAEHRIRYTDGRVCDLLGIQASELAGKTVSEAGGTLKSRFVHPDQFEVQSTWLCEHPTETAEHVLQLVSSDHRTIHRYSAPLLDESGSPAGRIDVYSDITRRRELEEAHISLYKQTCAAYEELKAAQDQLVQSEKLRAIGEIASGVAHDFNNTLGIILGNIQLLLRSAADEKSERRLKAVEQAALDGAETVRRIREFTRIQPDEPLSTIDLGTLSTSVLDVMRPSWDAVMQAKDRHVDVEFDLTEGVHALGIAAEMREVLANIFLNALQAMPEGGTLRISTGSSDGTSWVRVSDTGTGMSEDVRKRVFDPFFTTKGVEGTGLGMSVAYGIVKRHNGRISVESTEGVGTTITISLPAAEEQRADSLRGTAPSAEVTPVRILVVDDEEGFREVFMDMLSEHGHAVCVAQNGFDALDRFKSDAFDLVFTDLGMPEMSGWQVARGIKDLKPATPVVLLTGWGSKVDESKVAESQIDMVLSKPVKMEDLGEIVSKALKRG